MLEINSLFLSLKSLLLWFSRVTMNIQMDYKTNCSKSDSITTNALKQCLSKLSTEITIIEVENESLRNNAKGGTQNFLKIFFLLKLM